MEHKPLVVGNLDLVGIHWMIVMKVEHCSDCNWLHYCSRNCNKAELGRVISVDSFQDKAFGKYPFAESLGYNHKGIFDRCRRRCWFFLCLGGFRWLLEHQKAVGCLFA